MLARFGFSVCGLGTVGCGGDSDSRSDCDYSFGGY